MRLSDYNTPLSGMLAAQLGLKTTQQNLSNVHTPGYVRQMVNYGTVGGSNGNTFTQQIGYGVETLSIDRITDEIKAGQYNNQLSQFAQHSYMGAFLSEIEASVGMPGEGSLPSLMNKFLNGFREIAKNPGQTNNYHALIADAKKFMDHVNRLEDSLGKAKLTAQKDTVDHIGEFNRLSKSLAEANKKIGEAGSPVPSQLLDERDAIITEMSQYANIEVSYESINPNIASVRINGMLTVSGQDTYEIQLNANKTGIQISGTDVPLKGGSILATFEAQEAVTKYEEKLQGFMNSLKDEVNTVTTDAGIGEFFQGEGKEIHINKSFEKDPLLMKINDLNQLQKLKDIADFDYSALNDLVVGIAADVKQANVKTAIHGDMLNGIAEQKQGMEGVNIDEEMVNLMTYQRYFIANSKAINTLNEVFDSLFSIMR
ncbi:flagellar hook-associated protein FlgK [Bacillus manliponensis]|uniref:flagellar hook-associated protein FlgK n=1 Tax=Bacillus manliponensis TaxID=574376 RepID=UPI003514208D